MDNPGPPRRAAAPSPTVVLAVALGGGLGATARYGATRLWDVPVETGFPWTILAVNTLGCALIGALMVITEERGHRLARPFLGTGVLGGFTTFSAYAGGARTLTDAGRVGPALGYLVLTLAAAMAAVWAGTAATRSLRAGSRP
ncbi:MULTISPECIES: fluoride efflux transporter FluC [Streptomyces]|uniref:Fluoride-specific ion channel FluC n=1 Tax=Streptomyces cheonanensis TaxID=312720 RepID=A0ABN2VD86_9ACTN|nr:CrcB family protein [Streptomyces harbinensis]